MAQKKRTDANLKTRHYRRVAARAKTESEIWRTPESEKNNSPDVNDTGYSSNISFRNNSSCAASFAIWPRVNTVV